MSFIKKFELSKEGLQADYDRAVIINDTAQSLKDSATNFKNAANTYANGWAADETIVNNHLTILYESSYYKKEKSGQVKLDGNGNPIVDTVAFNKAQEKAKTAVYNWIADQRHRF